MTELQKEAMAYTRAKFFLDELHKAEDILPYTELCALKDMALQGNIRDATKKLARLLQEREMQK